MKNIKMNKTLFLLLIAFCGVVIPSSGQNYLDELLKTKNELKTTKEQKAAEAESLRSQRDALAKEVEDGKKDLTALRSRLTCKEKDCSKEELARLQHKIDSLKSVYNAKSQELASRNKDYNTKTKTISEQKKSISAGEKNYGDIHFEENLLRLGQPFSSLTPNDLKELEKLRTEYAKEQKYKDFDLKLQAARYCKECEAFINAPYEEETMVKLYEKYTELVEKEKISQYVSPAQLEEMNELDKKRSRYKNGVKKLRDLLDGINNDETIKSLRLEHAVDKAKECSDLILSKLDPAQNADVGNLQDRYFNMIPYLGDKLRAYMDEVRKDPFTSPTKTENELQGIKTE